MSKPWEILSLTAALSLSLATQAGGIPPDDPRRISPPKRIPDVIEQPLEPQGQSVTIASMPREVRRAVVSDAAKRFQVRESAVVLVRAERVTWSDGSLGCPQPGLSYTQALVPGYRVTAKTDSGQFVYHTDDRGNVVSCGPLPRRQRTQPPVVPPDR